MHNLMLTGQRPRRLIPLSTATLVIGLLFAGCSSGGTTTVGSDGGGGGGGNNSGLQIVNLGLVPTKDAAPIFLGIQQGFFKDEGLQLQTSQADSGGTILTGVVQGSYDVGYIAAPPAIVAASKGLPITEIAGNTTTDPNSPGGFGIVVKSDSPIQSFADLGGKTVSTNSLGNLLDLCLRSVLNQNKVDQKTVKVIELPFNQVAPSIQQSQINAGSLVDPFLAQALATGNFRSIGDMCAQGLPNNATQSLFIASKQTISGKSDLVAKFKRALQRAQSYLNDNPDAFAKIVPSYTKISAQDAAGLVKNVYSSDIDQAGYTALLNLMVQQGQIKSASDVQGFVP